MPESRLPRPPRAGGAFRRRRRALRVAVLVVAGCAVAGGIYLVGRHAGGADARASLSGGPPDGAGATHRPNILFITIDTLRADHLGCYGYAGARTPVIDRLAASGVVFEQASTVAPITLPSHVSIFTGDYPARHGVRNNGTYVLGPEARTLAEILRDGGYRTGAVIASHPLAARYGLDQGFETYDEQLPPEGARQLTYRERPAGDIARAGIAWLEQHPRERFFLWLHFFDPHAPYDPPAPHLPRGRTAAAAAPAHDPAASVLFAADAADVALYDGEVAYVDEQIGEVLKALDASRAGPTVVVVVSDHGEGLGEHGEPTHGVFLYESTIHVPLIVALPGVLPPGRVLAPVRTIDILPTVLDLVAAPPAGGIQGVSLLPLVRGEGGPPPSAVSESLLPWENYGWSELHAVRIGDWKYIRAPRPELYDLSRDPGERHDLAGTRPTAGSRLRAALDEALVAGRPQKPAPGRRETLDAEARERLRSLGYIWAPVDQDKGHDAKDADALADPKDRIQVMRLREEGSTLYMKGDYLGAIAKYDAILAIDRGNDDARLRRGNARVAAGHYAGAEDDFRAVLEIRPQDTAALMNLAATLVAQGRFAAAAGAYHQVLELEPESYKAVIGAGSVLFRQGHYRRAAEMFRRARVLEPASVEAEQKLAAALVAIDKGRPEREAEAALRQAHVADPAAVVPAMALARFLYDEGRFEEVVDVARLVLRSKSQARDVRFALANALYRQGEFEAAAREYKVILTAAPADGAALFGSALVAMQVGDNAAALDHLERARRSVPSHPGVRRNLAILYDAAGRLDAAAAEYRAAIGLDPSAADLRYHLAQLLLKKGNVKGAATAFEAYLASGDGQFADAARRELAILRP